ncbi:MAG: TetR/AcrR family transcriptional regulator [Eubacteriales bacterium]|nr:TetR/AcrR family transcriptional regulator [Eubacteriales bacterium]
MSKAYSAAERETIKAALRTAAMESMKRQGVRKTTVDELVREVHIPKGTFYLFYDSKELLLYDTLMAIHEPIHRELAARIQAGGFTPDSLTEMLNGFYNTAFDSGLLSLLVSGELEMLVRRLPDELVARHIDLDDDFCHVFGLLFPKLAAERLDDYSAAFRAVFFMPGHRREIGSCWQAAQKLLIRGLIMQMWEESK